MTDEVMTLHELCDAFGISRRTVQGYEKLGLVRATGRNPRGYLLYDLQMQTTDQKAGGSNPSRRTKSPRNLMISRTFAFRKLLFSDAAFF